MYRKFNSITVNFEKIQHGIYLIHIFFNTHLGLIKCPAYILLKFVIFSLESISTRKNKGLVPKNTIKEETLMDLHIPFIDCPTALFYLVVN